MRSVITYTAIKVLEPGRIIGFPFETIHINSIICGTPYTWYKGFGFEEWVDGNVVRLYCAYYDGDKLAYVIVSELNKIPTAYGIRNGILTKNATCSYHMNVASATHNKYRNVYKNFTISISNPWRYM